MIPYRDTNPGLTAPVFTLLIIVASTVVFVVLQRGGTDGAQLYELSAIPCEVMTGDPLDIGELERGVCDPQPQGEPVFPSKSVELSLVASIFLHGGWLHLATNMLSLWIFGNNVEDALGRAVFLVFYLASGVLATFAHIWLNQDSLIPLVGASGAIAGVMGVYLVLFPHARVHTIIIPLLVVRIRAWVFLILWFVSQFFLIGGQSAVAWEAHVGGFLVGLTLALVLRRPLMRRLHRLRFPFGVETEPPHFPRRVQ